MGKEKEKIKKIEDPKLVEFRKSLRDWVTSPDGEDFCPESWERYLAKIRGKDSKLELIVKEDSRPTSSIAETRKASDGWLVMCSEEGCKNEVFLPFKKVTVSVI